MAVFLRFSRRFSRTNGRFPTTRSKKPFLALLMTIILFMTGGASYGDGDGASGEDGSGKVTSRTLHTRYIRVLEPWIQAATKELHEVGDGGITYGLAQHSHWYMQAHDTAFCAFAILGTDPETDESRTGMSKEKMRETALAMLRWTLRSHIAGGGTCSDGQPWGHSWISMLGLERMSAGVDALEDYLDPELRALYAAVYASEADWLLTVPVKAGLVKENVPESNMWKGATLFRAAILNPDAPNAEAWREAAYTHFINSMSTPSDETNETVIDGKPVADRFVGANLFDSGACDHHGYQNVGYMNIIFSNLALLHFWCERHQVEPPESLYFNALREWKVVKTCLFDDGRLLRVGGDTRVRYCYCQDYAIFAWMLARDRFGDPDTYGYESGWLDQVEREQRENPDGWFMGKRLSDLWDASPLYFLRLEGDKACSLATAAYWHRVFDFDRTPTGTLVAPNRWEDDYHGTWLVKGTNRIASWNWLGALKAGGLTVPTDRSDMAEWGYNLAGQVFGVGIQNIAIPEEWRGYEFEGGFATCGVSRILSSDPIAEGEHIPEVGTLYLAFCALPDDRTSIAIQSARSGISGYLRRVRSLALSIPNDVFNDYERTLYSPDGEKRLRGIPERYELIDSGGNWLNLDNRLGVVEIYGGTPKVARLPYRQVTIQNHGTPKRVGGNLYCEVIGQTVSEGVTFQNADSPIFDSAAAVIVGDADQTRALAESDGLRRFESPQTALRLLSVRGADEIDYFIAVNFSDGEEPFDPGAAFARSDLIPLVELNDALPPYGIGIWKGKERR